MRHRLLKGFISAVAYDEVTKKIEDLGEKLEMITSRN